MVTGAVLFRSVLHEGLTVAHLYIFVALILALTSASAAKQSTGFTRFAFWGLFSISTIICVGLSGGRGVAEMDRNASSAQIENDNLKSMREKLTSLDHRKDELRREFEDAKRKAEDATPKEQCRWGDTPICMSAKQTHAQSIMILERARASYAQAETDYWSLRDKINTRKPQERGNSEWRSMARSIAVIFSTSEDRVLEIIVQVAPYLLSFLTEIGGVLHLGRAFAVAPLIPKPVSFPDDNAVTIGDIARELNIEPRIARKLAREKGIPKPQHGAWSWTRTQADEIKSKIGPNALH